jgi:hypothetical protein
VKPPYLGDGGRCGEFMAGDEVEVGGFGGGDVIEAEKFGAGEVVDIVAAGDGVLQCLRSHSRGCVPGMSARG